MKLRGEPGKNIRRGCKATPGPRSGSLQLRSRKNAKGARMAAGQMKLNRPLLTVCQLAVNKGAERVGA
jgi:hypothetical protein